MRRRRDPEALGHHDRSDVGVNDDRGSAAPDADDRPGSDDHAPRVVVESAPDRVERRSMVIDAPPSAIFDLLADPRRHHRFDGSGTVRQSADDAPERLSLGAEFGMGMKRFVPYRMTNEVVEFTENEAIAWRHLGGHVWRYTLEPHGSGTKVTEEFDWRPSRIPWILIATRTPRTNAASIEATLRRLASIVTG